jgi:ribosomal RNA-processing protein 8
MKRNRKDKLDAGKFRLINEILYTSNSADSWELFQKDPSYFHIYHQGFNTQVSSWPINPLKIVENEIRRLATDHKVIVTDLGCGQGDLEINLKDLDNVIVYSYDLISTKEHVIECDISKLPIRNRKVDIVVFCLSLMGINHVQMIKEAHRVLKKQGILIIAEVSTRFSQEKMISDLRKLGFKSIKIITPNTFFTVFVLKKIKASDEDVFKILEPCKYKKR